LPIVPTETYPSENWDTKLDSGSRLGWPNAVFFLVQVLTAADRTFDVLKATHGPSRRNTFVYSQRITGPMNSSFG